MCVKLSPGDLNPGPYPSHPTSIYTCGVTNTPRVHGGLFWSLKWIQFCFCFCFFSSLAMLESWFWNSYLLIGKTSNRSSCLHKQQLLGVHHVFINTATAITRETQHVFMFLLLLSSKYITQLPLFKNSSLRRIKL